MDARHLLHCFPQSFSSLLSPVSTGESNEEKDRGFRNVVLATDASGAMDCQEVKRISVGRNQRRQVTSTQGS